MHKSTTGQTDFSQRFVTMAGNGIWRFYSIAICFCIKRNYYSFILTLENNTYLHYRNYS